MYFKLLLFKIRLKLNSKANSIMKQNIKDVVLSLIRDLITVHIYLKNVITFQYLIFNCIDETMIILYNYTLNRKIIIFYRKTNYEI